MGAGWDHESSEEDKSQYTSVEVDETAAGAAPPDGDDDGDGDAGGKDLSE
jgi:hypothetical protein